ncbi:MAG: hypothetical protein A3K67_01455 [Euryarchaeota archaeon RBG_16_62_10]|nr:MAG: hypothetical protein A3K67_01455 [Euryarchaeota archaeon RBG_16_62_10]
MVLILLLVVAVPAVMLLSMGVFGGTSSDTHWGMMSFSGGGWLLMAVPVAIVIILLILLGTSEPRGSPTAGPAYPVQYQGYPPGTSQRVDAFAILDRRLASGEISLEEYGRIKAELVKR